MIDGHVVWKYDLGTTPAKIVSVGKYNDNKWHQVTATRSGKFGTLRVRTHNDPDDFVEGIADGDYRQLDLLFTGTRIFAGGVPDNFSLPSEVMNRHFIGGLDDFSYSENKNRLGLWNFVDGTSNADGNLKFIYNCSGYVTLIYSRSYNFNL